MHYRAWTRSPDAWPSDLFDELSEEELEQSLESLSDGFVGADANNLLSQAETWKRHDVGNSKGFVGNLQGALGSIQARVLLMPSSSDQFFPLTDAVFESKLIPGAKLLPIQSCFGHMAGGGIDPDAITAMEVAIKQFLNSIGSQESNGRSSENERRQLARATVATSSDGDKFLIGARKENPRQMGGGPTRRWGFSRPARRAAKDLALASGNGGSESEQSPRSQTCRQERQAPFIARICRTDSHIVVLIKGAFCKLCMAQLEEFQQQLGPSKVPVVVVTPVNDLEELADIPYSVLADPEFKLFGRRVW